MWGGNTILFLSLLSGYGSWNKRPTLLNPHNILNGKFRLHSQSFRAVFIEEVNFISTKILPETYKLVSGY